MKPTLVVQQQCKIYQINFAKVLVLEMGLVWVVHCISPSITHSTVTPQYSIHESCLCSEKLHMISTLFILICCPLFK